MIYMSGNEFILVSYQDIPYGKKFPGSIVTPISEEEFHKLEGSVPYRQYDNMYMQELSIQVTGKCNFNCCYCFTATDNNPLNHEMSMEQAVRLMDMAEECGICSIGITGGEPTVHPHLSEIIRGFADRGIYTNWINTNGYILTQELLDTFRECGMSPEIKISFDGIGVQDSLSGVSGSEQAALNAIRLCLDNHFNVYVQMQVNRRTAKSIPESLKLLDKMGVNAVNLVKTIEAPRWAMNENGDNFNVVEAGEYCLKVVEDYSREPHHMKINVWEDFDFNPDTPSGPEYFPFYRILQDPSGAEKSLLCPLTGSLLSLGADGTVYLCQKAQGLMDQMKLSFGNVFVDGMQSILQKDSLYFKTITHTVAEKIQTNPKCRDCDYSRLCTTGCPGLSMYYHGDIMGTDDSVCDFYESGLYERILNLSGYSVRDAE